MVRAHGAGERKAKELMWIAGFDKEAGNRAPRMLRRSELHPSAILVQCKSCAFTHGHAKRGQAITHGGE